MRVPLLAILIGVPVVLAAGAGFGQSFEVVVSGQANIFGAGHEVAPDPGDGGGGVLPVEIAIPAGFEFVFSVPQVSGEVCATGAPTTCVGADGGVINGNTLTDILSWGGISGIRHVGKVLFLVGVFCDDTEPADPAPERLSYGIGGMSDEIGAYYPELRQVFYIGDGVGAGGLQEFHAPTGATRLFLGLADAWSFGNPPAVPGWYGDNIGELQLTVVLQQGAVDAIPSTFGSVKAAYR